MADNLIYTTISPKKLKFKPGSTPAKFEINVRNDSNDYASFQLAIEADYDKSKQQNDWYRISPEIGTFNPPGDLTKFKVELIDSPVPGFMGLMQLRIIVASVELPDKDTLLLPVEIEQGTLQLPLELTLPVKEFHKSPDSIFDIPVRIRNLGQLPTNVNLNFLGIDTQWLIDGSDRNFKLEAGAEISQTFTCKLPESIDTIAKNYIFTIQAEHTHGNSSNIEGIIEVLPMGYLNFSCEPKELTIPQRFSFAFWRSDPVTYLLQGENCSNKVQELVIEIEKDENKQDNGIFEVVELETQEEEDNITGIIESIELQPSEVEPIPLRASAKRSWFGNPKRILREVHALWSNSDAIDTRNENQTIILNVKPIIPTWLLISGGILLFYFIYFLLWLSPKNFSHEDSVNSVQFNGIATHIISGSTDETMIKWDVTGFKTNWDLHKPKLGDIANVGKMIRVINYKPVDNNVIAAGLENGEIQLWDLLSSKNKPLASFSYSQDDRVLALTFTPDSRFLFSGHGSGHVLLWDITKDLRGLNDPNKQPQGKQKFDFSVLGLKLIGNEQNHLAIVGRYNQFLVWNLANGQVRPVNYGLQTGQDDYIQSIDVAELNPYLVVTSDNKGYITLWDLSNCSRSGEGTCGKILDRWQDGHDKQAVRSIAIDANGCYLASGGDDGNTKLWYLNNKGSLAQREGIILNRSRHQKIFNAIDIMTQDDDIYIVSGNENNRVFFAYKDRNSSFGCDNFK